MDLKTFLLDLYLHMEWADAEIWRVVLDSEEASADEELTANLHHLHLVQHAFYDIWRAQEVNREAGAGLKGPELAAWARDHYPRLSSHLRSLSNDDLEQEVDMPWAKEISERLGFEPSCTLMRETAFQVCAHTTHHRAQAAAQLRRLGLTPPLSDYIAWIWRSRPEANWPI